MAYYAEEADQWAEYADEVQYDEDEHQLEEQLLEALDSHVQGSVNKALVNALKPFTKPLLNYGKRKFKSHHGGPSYHQSSEVLAKMAANVLDDHGGYGSSRQSSSSQFHDDDTSSSLPDTSDSDQSEAPKKASKKKRRSQSVNPLPPSKNLLFNPSNIIHPRSTEWVPCVGVAHYVQGNIRQGFVRSVLRSECPRPALLRKVMETPELDPNMATFLKKFSKDPKKGLDRAWRGCQDKLLDVCGPLTKILDRAVQAKESNTPLDTTEVLEWAQRALCFLGNANYAVSTERRRSFLMRIDTQLADMATSEAGIMANGLLFGDKFVKELGKYVSTFSALDKVQSNIKKVFNAGLFTRAGCNRGRAPGRGSNQASRGSEQRGRGGPHRSNFYPTRNRGGRGRGQKGGYRGNNNDRDTSYSVLRHLALTTQLLQELGFVINADKSVMTPSQSMEFLGFQVDSVTAQLLLLLKK
ncbi:uncharacterized protein LOC144761602 [Lissotriton helveticus]